MEPDQRASETTAVTRPRGRARAWLRNAVVGAAVLGSLLTAAAPAFAVDIQMRVPSYRQALADDCEASALRMLLAYRGHALTDLQLLAEIGVDRAHPHSGFSGPTSGDPFRAFVGNPNGSEARNTGYGVFYPRIAAAAAANHVKVLAAQENYAPARLYAQLAAGHPAVVWIDYLYRALHSTWYRAWDGRWVPYAGPNEHAVALVGVTTNGVYVHDPARGSYWIRKSTFEAGYSTYHDMAVVIG